MVISPCTIVIELRTNGLDFLNKESSHLIRQFKVIHIVGVHGTHFSYFNQFFNSNVFTLLSA